MATNRVYMRNKRFCSFSSLSFDCSLFNGTKTLRIRPSSNEHHDNFYCIYFSRTLKSKTYQYRTMTTIERRGNGRIRLKCIALGAANAGKTSILRRFFLRTNFDPRRVPTVGADFYTSSVRNPAYHDMKEGDGGNGTGFESEEDEEKKATDTSSDMNNTNRTITQQHLWSASIAKHTTVGLQMWDTAGRERFMAKRQAKYSAALSDAFFRHADAAMLVYDATSSTSFTQLLQWHSDLMEKMESLETKERTSKRPFPVLIVANKMDLLPSLLSKPALPSSSRRNVMGLGNDFKGKDSRYEYRAPSSNTNKNNEPASNSRREEISTYMRTGNTWTTDGSYLDSVLNTEDRSHPDKDLVLLWCMRNGLKHMEVSAMDGTGIDAAIEALVELALESANERLLEQTNEKQQHQHQHQQQQQQQYSISRVMEQQHVVTSNKGLDLHERYTNKDNNCGFWPPLARLKKSH